MSRHCGSPIVPLSLTALLLFGLALASQQQQQHYRQQPPAPVPPPTLTSPSAPPPATPVFTAAAAAAAVITEEADPNEEPAAAEAESVETATLEMSPQDALPKIRKAVRDHIRERYPNSRVEGVFTLSLGRGNTLYLAGADTIAGQDRKRHTIDVLVRLYARRNGSGYWRAESLGRDEAAALLRRGAGEPAAP